MIDNHNDLLAGFIYSDKATSHISDKISWHGMRVWGKEKPHIIIVYETDSPKLNLFCAISKERFYGPLFFFCGSHRQG
jgi:hypothetical protein